MSGTAHSPFLKMKTNKESKEHGIPVKACIKCGAVWKRLHYCPAEKQTCKSCGKIGHLTAYCLFKKDKANPRCRDRINNVNDTNNFNNNKGHPNLENWQLSRNFENQPASNSSLVFKDTRAQSICHYSRLIKLYPKDPQNYDKRSICYMMGKEYENAFTDSLKVIELNPSCVGSYCRLIKCAIILGYTVEAVIYVKKLARLDPGNETLAIECEKLSDLQRLILKENMAVRGDNYKEALEIVCVGLAISSENLSLKLKKAEYLALLKRYAESEAVVKEILKQDCGNMRAKYIGGFKVYQLDIDAAVNYFKEILDVDPSNSKARDLYEKARRISNKKRQGNDEFLKKNFKAAHKLYSSALGIDPGHVNMQIKLHFNMGQASWNLKKYLRAITEYTKVITIDEKHYLARKQRGKCHLAIGEYREAINDFSQVLKLSPTDSDCLKLIDDAATAIWSLSKEDPYEILGVSRDITIEELKRVYDHKELLHHLNRVISATEEQQKEYDDDFKEVTLAYSNLLTRLEKKVSSNENTPAKLYNLSDG